MGFFRDPESRSRGFGIGIFYFGLNKKTRKSRNPRKSPRDFPSWIFNPRASGFVSPEISRNPRDPGFFQDFLPSGSGFFLRDRDFFRGTGYPDKKPTLIITYGQKSFLNS